MEVEMTVMSLSVDEDNSVLVTASDGANAIEFVVNPDVDGHRFLQLSRTIRVKISTVRSTGE